MSLAAAHVSKLANTVSAHLIESKSIWSLWWAKDQTINLTDARLIVVHRIGYESWLDATSEAWDRQPYQSDTDFIPS